MRRKSENTIEGIIRSIRSIYWQEWKFIVKRMLKELPQTEDITERESLGRLNEPKYKIMSRGKHFSAEEIEFIKVNALVMTTTEIAKKLNRNYWAIHRKMQELGISKSHTFTANEDFIIRQMYGKFPAKAIATKIGVDENAIYNRCKKLKLTKGGTK